MEAKKVIGELDWVEIISYYRFVGGNNVFVYIIGEGDKKQIIDFVDEENNVLLLNKYGNLEIDTYDNVTNSRKVFEYSDDYEKRDYYLDDVKITIPIKIRD